jgi:hypothetical protein
MAEAQDVAQNRRNRGQSTSVHASWRVQKILPSGLDAIEAYYNQYRRDIHINAYCAVEWCLFGDDLKDFCEF